MGDFISTHILLVDDNPVQAEARRAILMRSGAAVFVASDGLEALALLGDAAVRGSIAVMVTDHVMPGMHGPELVERTRALLPTLPILVLSGLNFDVDEFDPHHIVFRVKPFPPAELIRLITLMLGDQELRTA